MKDFIEKNIDRSILQVIEIYNWADYDDVYEYVLKLFNMGYTGM